MFNKGKIELLCSQIISKGSIDIALKQAPHIGTDTALAYILPLKQKQIKYSGRKSKHKLWQDLTCKQTPRKCHNIWPKMRR